MSTLQILISLLSLPSLKTQNTATLASFPNLHDVVLDLVFTEANEEGIKARSVEVLGLLTNDSNMSTLLEAEVEFPSSVQFQERYALGFRDQAFEDMRMDVLGALGVHALFAHDASLRTQSLNALKEVFTEGLQVNVLGHLLSPPPTSSDSTTRSLGTLCLEAIVCFSATILEVAKEVYLEPSLGDMLGDMFHSVTCLWVLFLGANSTSKDIALQVCVLRLSC